MTSPYRSLAKASNSAKVEVAPGIRIRRPFPGPAGTGLDPFLMLDHFGPKPLPTGKPERVPPHPHRGFEPVTILFEGAVEHRDSLGNRSVIKGGDVQWMTAGSGVIHSETLTGGKDATIHGIQLWVNLPRSQKMRKPTYRNYVAKNFPRIELPGGSLTLFAGKMLGKTGPIKSGTPVLLAEIKIEPGTKLDLPIPDAWNAGIYVIAGEMQLGEGRKAKEGWFLTYRNEGEAIQVEVAKASHLLLMAGKPLREPVVSHGPFVMNSKKEILDALRDFETGKMGSLRI